ncbi:MAG: hypothetical protein WD468_00290 [Pirellulales bacterium]
MVHDSGQMGASEIGADGSYRLEAAVGPNAVLIRCRDEPNLSTMGADADRGFKRAKSLIPTKYENRNSSGLKIDVVDGPNEKDWALAD